MKVFFLESRSLSAVDASDRGDSRRSSSPAPRLSLPMGCRCRPEVCRTSSNTPSSLSSLS
eukprot:scaffold2368_cov248-Pinguiococcus_pyrenoidosus.AAC.8